MVEGLEKELEEVGGVEVGGKRGGLGRGGRDWEEAGMRRITLSRIINCYVLHGQQISPSPPHRREGGGRGRREITCMPPPSSPSPCIN